MYSGYRYRAEIVVKHHFLKIVLFLRNNYIIAPVGLSPAQQRCRKGCEGKIILDREASPANKGEA